MLTPAQKRYLRKLYFTPRGPASYSGLAALLDIIKRENRYKLKKKDVREWLEEQETYTVFKEPPKTSETVKVLVSHIDEQWDADSAHMRRYARENRGYSYFLVVVDTVSRFAWTRAQKTLTAEETGEGLRSVLEGGRRPQRLRTDRGTEFRGAAAQRVLRDKNVDHFTTNNDTKANYAERLIRTLKRKLYKYMSEKQTNVWYNALPLITESYNATPHRGLGGKAPKDVTEEDQAEIWFRRVDKPKSRVPTDYKYAVGETVRITTANKPFERAFDEQFTREFFYISNRLTEQGIHRYELVDADREAILGKFYTEELQKTIEKPDKTYLIQEVIERQRQNGVWMSKVKWYGWPDKFDSWIPSRRIANLPRIVPLPE